MTTHKGGKNPKAPRSRDPMVGCPRGCGHQVKLSKSGDPHVATRTVQKNGRAEIEHYTCK